MATQTIISTVRVQLSCVCERCEKMYEGQGAIDVKVVRSTGIFTAAVDGAMQNDPNSLCAKSLAKRIKQIEKMGYGVPDFLPGECPHCGYKQSWGRHQTAAHIGCATAPITGIILGFILTKIGIDEGLSILIGFACAILTLVGVTQFLNRRNKRYGSDNGGRETRRPKVQLL